MLADIVNKRVDSHYKARLAWWETWKALALIVGGVATLFGVLGGFVGFKIASTPPPAPAIILQLPPGTTITTPGKAP